MIAKLTGLIDEFDEDSLILNVGGVGYLVFCSSKTLGQLTVGHSISLMIETHVREDQIALYGFLENIDRQWFRMLVTVQGVGARVALAVLGIFSIPELVDVISMEDKKSMTRTPGVGPKLAQRILIELKDKVGDKLPDSSANINQLDTSILADEKATKIKDAVSALINLGYTAPQAFAVVSKVSAKVSSDVSVEVLIRDSLGLLGPGEDMMRGS